jgi:hypothetical protein
MPMRRRKPRELCRHTAPLKSLDIGLQAKCEGRLRCRAVPSEKVGSKAERVEYYSLHSKDMII